MKLGLIARCDDRGIASETMDFHRAMKPDKTLVVRMNDPDWPEYIGRFRGPGVTYVDFDRRQSIFQQQRVVKDWLRGIDVLWAVETMYDWRLVQWAREAKIKTVVRGNPELYVHHRQNLQHPDRWAWPTEWLLDSQVHPPGPIIPVPAPDWSDVAAPHDTEALHVVHVAGHAAIGDRNGTEIFMQALASIRSKVVVTVVGQDGKLPNFKHSGNVQLNIITAGVESRQDLYRGQHLVVLPRRYGGGCMPAIEAAASGCVTLMPDVIPNRMWPGVRLNAHPGRLQRTKFGGVPTAVLYPLDIAHAIDVLNRDRDQLADRQAMALEWAENNSWEELKRRVYDPFLAAVASGDPYP